jgi:uncharacterized membrane protein
MASRNVSAQWRWVGIAVALGGVFLVRYSIEQGLLGPGVRVTLGALLAIALVVTGEWARRTERLAGIGGLPTAHIPSVLTAAGTMVAYADVYAAYALYDFLPPAIAFILLGLVALATMAAALLHGPALAGLGLVGAYVTPLLVSTGKPDYWSLYAYLAVVTAAAFALARVRMWRWLAITAVVLSALWGLPGMGVVSVDALGAHAFHVIVGFALAAALIVAGLLFGPDEMPGRIDGVSSASLGAYLLVATLLVLASRHDPAALVTFVVLVAATVAIAWRDAAAAAVPAAAVLAVLVMVRWAVDPISSISCCRRARRQARYRAGPSPLRWHLTLGALLALLFGGAGYLAQFVRVSASSGRSFRSCGARRHVRAARHSGCALLPHHPVRALAPVRRDRVAAERALRIATENWTSARHARLAAASALFATGAVAALALALAMALAKGWLTIGLALMVPASPGWRSSPLPALVLTAVVGVLVLVRTGGAAHRRQGYRHHADLQLVALRLRRSCRRLLAGRLAAAPTGRRYTDAHDRFRRHPADRSGGVPADPALRHRRRHLCRRVEPRRACAAGLCRARHDHRARATAAAHAQRRARYRRADHCGAHARGDRARLFLGQNPMHTGEPVGGPFVNLILLGYGLPAVLAATLALTSRGVRPPKYSTTAAVTVVALAIAYLSLESGRCSGEVLSRGLTSNAEQYTYSAVGFAFGVALLAAGVGLRSQAVREPIVVVILTVLKVFLVDMRDLTGIYQGLSFIGLGIVLLGIGWLYQRLLFPRRMPASQ